MNGCPTPAQYQVPMPDLIFGWVWLAVMLALLCSVGLIVFRALLRWERADAAAERREPPHIAEVDQ